MGASLGSGAQHSETVVNIGCVWIELIVAETENWKLKTESTITKKILNMWIISCDPFLIFLVREQW